MKVGLNVGAYSTKAHNGTRTTVFPSLAAPLVEARFTARERVPFGLEEPQAVIMGLDAARTRQAYARIENEAWYTSDLWRLFSLGALSEMALGTAELQVMTGLPQKSYTDELATDVKNWLLGEHTLQRIGRNRQTLTITHARVIPEAYGTVFDLWLNGNGSVRDNRLRTQHVAVADVGGKTTNLLSVDELERIQVEERPLDRGGWDIARDLERELGALYPGVDFADAELQSALQTGYIQHYGKRDVTQVCANICEQHARYLVGIISQVWPLQKFDLIVLTGGGSILIRDQVIKILAEEHGVPGHMILTPDDPVLANARGFWKWSNIIWP